MNYTFIEKLTIPSELSNITMVEAMIDRICLTIGVQEDSYGNILIAITEAFNNAVIHGNKFDSTKDVSILVNENDDVILFSVSDLGSGFDYTSLPDPTAPENIEKENGRGIFLIKNLADEVSFSETGQVITISFNKI